MAIVNLFDEQMTESAAEDLITELRRKLAEQQALVKYWSGAHDIPGQDKDELTAQLSAAKQEGYEQGYAKGSAVSVEAEVIAEQRGRDEVLRELSEQYPVAWLDFHNRSEPELQVVFDEPDCIKSFDSDVCWKKALIIRPSAPEKGEKK